jgi:hypothetical protein
MLYLRVVEYLSRIDHQHHTHKKNMTIENKFHIKLCEFCEFQGRRASVSWNSPASLIALDKFNRKKGKHTHLIQ